LNDPFFPLRARFVDRSRDQLAALRLFLSGGEALTAATADGQLLKIAHSLAGAGGTFGFPDVSVLASRLEILLTADDAIEPKDVSGALGALIAELERLTP